MLVDDSALRDEICRRIVKIGAAPKSKFDVIISWAGLHTRFET